MAQPSLKMIVFACAGLQEEVILNLRLASVLYMHTPRLVAEVLAISDEAGDIVKANLNPDLQQVGRCVDGEIYTLFGICTAKREINTALPPQMVC